MHYLVYSRRNGHFELLWLIQPVVIHCNMSVMLLDGSVENISSLLILNYVLFLLLMLLKAGGSGGCLFCFLIFLLHATSCY